MVNAVLQMLDGYQGESLIIAATNHETMLDSAIWRRFEEVFLFPMPTGKQLVELLTIKLRGVRRDFEVNDPEVLGLFQDMSFADIERTLRRGIKEMILKGQEFLQLRHLKKAQAREVARKQLLTR